MPHRILGALVLATIAWSTTPFSPLADTSVPGAPTNVSAQPGTLSATVQWTASGAPAANYIVTANPGGVSATVPGSSTSATVTGLGFATTYTFTVAGTNASGTSPGSPPSNPVRPDAPGGPYRPGIGRVLLDSNITAADPLAFNNGEDRVHAPGLAAVALNVIASEATEPASLQILVRGEVVDTVPVVPGRVESSLAVIAVAQEMNPAVVQVTAGQAHVQIDFEGVFTDPSTVRDRSGLLQLVQPATLFDDMLQLGESTDIPVSGQADVPASSVGAVLLNIMAINPSGAGSVVVSPTGPASGGQTTAVAFVAGQTMANRALVPLPANGAVTITDHGAASEIRVDVLGWFSDGTDSSAVGSLYSPVSPLRLLDTGAGSGPVPAGGSITVAVRGKGGVPDTTAPAPGTSALFEVTAVSPSGAGSIGMGDTSVVAFSGGQTTSSEDVVKLADDGTASVKLVGAASNVTVDLLGYLSGDAIVPGSTKVLSAIQLAGITRIDDRSVTFAPGDNVSPPILLNDVIVGGFSTATPDGLIRRVLSISSDPNGSTVLGTRLAGITEAFTSFSVEWSTPAIPGAFGMKSTGAQPTLAAPALLRSNPFPPPPGTSIDPRYDVLAIAKPPRGLIINLPQLDTRLDNGSELDINDFEIQLRTHFSMYVNNGKLHMSAALAVGIRAAIELQLLAQVNLIQADHLLENFIAVSGPIFLLIAGFIPLEFQPGITYYFSYRLSLNGGVVFGLNLDSFRSVSGGYDGNNFFADQAGAKDYLNPSQVFTFRAAIQAQEELDLHLIPSIHFYGGVVLVGADVMPFARLTIDPGAPVWWDVTIGVCRVFKMHIDLFFTQKDTAFASVCVTITTISAPGPRLNVVVQPASATVPRSGTQHFQAAVVGNDSGVTWSLNETGGGSLSNQTPFEVDYTAPLQPGTYHLHAAAVADQTSFFDVVITVPAVAPSPPRNVTTALSGPNSITVAWGAPADDGGRPITNYKVVSSDGTTKDVGTSTSVTFTGLTPGTTYTFSVYATNGASLTSAATVSRPITVPPATPVTVQPPSVDFGTLSLNQVSSPQTVTVFATNQRALSISTLTLSGTRPQDYTIQSDLCSGQLVPAGGSCSFAVVFTAIAAGPSSASVLINDDDQTSPQSVSLVGQVSAGVVVAACYLNTIAGGDRDTVVVDPSGKVFAWGANQYGQLGNGTNTPSTLPVAVSTSTGLPQVAEVSAGFYQTVVRTTSGTVWAWGNNSFGELGNTTVPNGSNVPVQVMDAGGTGFLTGVSDVSGSSFGFAVAVKSADGSVWAWGENTSGELGNGTTTNSPTPVQVEGPGGVGFLTGVVKVAAGDRFVVALKSDGTVWAWGENGAGELGNNTTTMETTPVQVLGPNGVGFLTGIIAIGSHSFHTVAVRSDGTLVAWGNDPYGQLGNGITPPSGPFNIPYPVVVSTLSGLTNQPSVVTGGEHSLAADPTSGKAWGWGWNVYGQLGDATQIQRLTPSQVVAAVNFTEVAAGAWHSVGLGSDGSVWTWGYNFYGQLGNGQSGQAASLNATPHAVSGVTAAQPQPC